MRRPKFCVKGIVQINIRSRKYEPVEAGTALDSADNGTKREPLGCPSGLSLGRKVMAKATH
jgi:hypothetical protein